MGDDFNREVEIGHDIIVSTDNNYHVKFHAKVRCAYAPLGSIFFCTTSDEWGNKPIQNSEDKTFVYVVIDIPEMEKNGRAKELEISFSDMKGLKRIFADKKLRDKLIRKGVIVPGMVDTIKGYSISNQYLIDEGIMLVWWTHDRGEIKPKG